MGWIKVGRDEILAVAIGDRTFSIVWSVIGEALFVGILRFLRPRHRDEICRELRPIQCAWHQGVLSPSTPKRNSNSPLTNLRQTGTNA